MHKHHILPRKAPYLTELHSQRNETEWIVSLTIDGHSCQHDILFRCFGWVGDKIARDALLGQINSHEATLLAREDFIRRNPEHFREAGRKGGRAKPTKKSKNVAAELCKRMGGWWTDGSINKRSISSPGPSFRKGRIGNCFHHKR